ncbi:MAG: hypothetical protein QUS12_12100 [Methanosarcina sp.]|nr:hypothetical protein [Methanosarcina sp.]
MPDVNNIQFDAYQTRCPKLGHAVAFSYCRMENKGLPCFKALDCWFQTFPVEEYLRERLTKEEWETSFESKRPTKVQSLIELILAAKKQV